MKDKNTTINDLLKLIANFGGSRGWSKYHTPRNLATSIALESSELLELFQWDLDVFDATQIKNNKERMEEIKKEMADIVIYSLSMASILNIDLASSIVKKINHNRKKYPIKYFNKKGQDSEYYKKIKAEYRIGKVK